MILLPRYRMLGGNAAATGGYALAAMDYDGTNDNQLRGADLTGNADGKVGTVSFWFRLDGGNGAAITIISSTSAFTRVQRDATTNLFSVVSSNSAGVQILSMTSSNAYTAESTWHHFFAAWDLANARGEIYIDGASDRAALPTLLDDTIDYTRANWAIGSSVAESNRFNGCLAELAFHPGVFIDPDVAANLAKFRNPDTGKPVNLGLGGVTAFGSTAKIYARNGDASVNEGNGGNFTTTGALTVCSSTP